MKQTVALHQLQDIDSDIDRIRARLAEIDTLLGQNAAVRAARSRRAAAEQTLRDWQTRQADLQLERSQLQQEAAASEERLYSGRVHNPRELADLQDKVAELKRRQESLDEPAIEALLEIEAAEEELQAAEANLERVTAEQADTLGALRDEQAALQDNLAARLKEVEPARKGIDPTALAQYDRLRKRPGGLAVAALSRNAECTACGVQLTSSMAQRIRRGDVIACPTCERILYLP